MDRRKRELVWAGAAVLAAAVIALLATPPPPMLRAVEDEAWARGIEFVVLTFVFWTALATLGILHAKVALGLDGISAERQNQDREGEALRGVREANLELAQEVVHQQRIVRELRGSQEELEQRVRRLEADMPVTQSSVGARDTEDGSRSVGTLPPSGGEAK